MVLAALAGCGGDPERPRVFSPVPTGCTVRRGRPDPRAEATPSTRGPAQSVPDGVLGEALRHVPDEAAVATVTDFDRVRARLGVPDLTSADLMTDRFRFWEQTPARPSCSTRAGCGTRTPCSSSTTASARTTWTGSSVSRGTTPPASCSASGPTWTWARCARRSRTGPDRSPGRPSWPRSTCSSLATPHRRPRRAWADESWAAAAGAQPADSYYLRSGRGACIPLEDTLGGEATVEDQERVLDRADVRSLDRIDAVALAFTGPATALALLSYAAPPAQDEVNRRAALGDAWPGSDDSAAYADGFTSATALPVTGDPVGVIRLGVRNPRAAAAVTFGDLLPFAVCDDVRLLPEPTGL